MKIEQELKLEKKNTYYIGIVIYLPYFKLLC